MRTKVKATQPNVASIRLVPVNKIKPAPWNPPARVSERNLEKLAESISDIGLIYPIALDENLHLIDGHKRLAVVTLMGWERVPAIVTSSEFAHAYGSLNANQQRMSGNDLLGIYLSNPLALIHRQKSRIKRLEDVCGLPAVRLLYKAGLTAGTFDIAMRVYRFIGTAIEPIGVLQWLIKHRMARPVRQLMEEGGVSSAAVVRAIRADKPLHIKFLAE